MDRLSIGFFASVLIIASVTGCTGLPEPLGADEEDLRVYPEEVQDILADADRCQAKGSLREAIEAVEQGLVDYPDSSPLRVRLAELRSQRQVCFVTDWNEADVLCERRSPASALLVLKRIERYGDREMIHRAREKIGEIQARNPKL